MLAPRSKFYQGPFGRIFPDLPAWEPDVSAGNSAGALEKAVEEEFLRVANDHMIEVRGPSKSPSELKGSDQDEKDDSNIPAGYTYFGQFVDHDITFDPISSLMRQNDPSGLLNHRTPRLDLDNLYGRGPGASRHLYDADDKFRFAIAHVKSKKEGTDSEFCIQDLPRIVKTAVDCSEPEESDSNRMAIAAIGDPRNDENIIVSQLHLAFLLAHNKLYDTAITLIKRKIANAKKIDEAEVELTGEQQESAFHQARTTLRWLYQYIVWNDFLRRISNIKIHAAALQFDAVDKGKKTKFKQWQAGFKDVYNWKHRPFIPVEFSTAAYRFGHTMVRNSYRTNIIRGPQPAHAVPIFDNSKHNPAPDDLRGNRKLEIKNQIQWNWFLNMEGSEGDFPQKARLLDTKLANALAFLHEEKLLPGEVVKEPRDRKLNFLAFRNLMRGYRFDLPSGTAVAHKFCLDPIPLGDDDLDSLWFYILKEAKVQGEGNKLGEVGSMIICATFAGLLLGDPNSYFNVQPCWQPKEDILLAVALDGTGFNEDSLLVDDEGKSHWTLASIIRLSGLPVSADDLQPVTPGGSSASPR
ncbi:MAG: peroxidase family protein [Anaerolineae bacterium]